MLQFFGGYSLVIRSMVIRWLYSFYTMDIRCYTVVLLLLFDGYTVVIQIYCCVVSTVLLLNMLRSLATFESFNSFDYVLSFKLTWLVLWYEGLSRASFANYLWYVIP